MTKTAIKTWNTAIYVRISKEDNSEKESSSITNQISMISDFCAEKIEFNVVDTYVDDGFRGGSFDRPAFLALKNDIEEKKVNCVIVKDLSRLGRDYLAIGRLVKHEFPEKGVRLISLGDSYDSEDNQDDFDVNKIIMLPFKAMMSEAYSIDLSKKITSQLNTMREKGEYVGAFAPYGYMRNVETKKLEIDSNVSYIIKRIFNMKIDGFTNENIASSLNNDGIESPLRYKEGYTNFKTAFKKSEESLWTSVSVKRILENEIYIGVLTQRKRTSKSYKNKNVVEVPEESWVIIENGVDSIVSTEDFYLVQKLLSMDTRINKDGKIDELSGLLFCSNCGEKLILNTFNSKGKRYSYYVCKNKSCGITKISKEIISKDILDTLKVFISATLDNSHIKDALRSFSLKNEDLETEIELHSSTSNKIEEYTNAYNELYINYHSKKLFSDDEYLFLKGELFEEIERCKKTLETQKNRIIELEKKVDKNRVIEKFEQNKNIENLTRRTVVKFIDFITYSKDKGLEITFNNINYVQER